MSRPPLCDVHAAASAAVRKHTVLNVKWRPTQREPHHLSASTLRLTPSSKEAYVRAHTHEGESFKKLWCKCAAVADF